MEKFTVHTGRALPLRRSNVDTDQIIPAVYLKRITRHGYEDALFAAWRKDPSFILNDPTYAGVSVLVAGPEFGTGSSRESCPMSSSRRPPKCRWPPPTRSAPSSWRPTRSGRSR